MNTILYRFLTVLKIASGLFITDKYRMIRSAVLRASWW